MTLSHMLAKMPDASAGSSIVRGSAIAATHGPNTTPYASLYCVMMSIPDSTAHCDMWTVSSYEFANIHCICPKKVHVLKNRINLVSGLAQGNSTCLAIL